MEGVEARGADRASDGHAGRPRAPAPNRSLAAPARAVIRAGSVVRRGTLRGRPQKEPVTISPAGSYVPMTTPVVETLVSTRRSAPGIAPSANRRLPEPRTTGNTHSRN